jgi:hypothetical protein
MAKEIQTKTGTCATHGRVQATRTIPKVTFPPIFTAILRARAKRRPYKCPECGADVSVS